MDPVVKLWMFENWVADQIDDAELAKNHAYLLGSFWNPEAVKKLMGDSGNTHISTDEEFEASTQLVKAAVPTKEDNIKNKRKRKKKIKV